MGLDVGRDGRSDDAFDAISGLVGTLVMTVHVLWAPLPEPCRARAEFS